MIEKIREVVAGYMGMRVSDINDEQSFLDISMDSLTLLKIIIELEQVFNIRIENDEIVEIRTILDILNLMEKKISQ